MKNQIETEGENEIEIYLKENYVFKFNHVLDRTLFKEADSDGELALLKSYEFNSILRELKNKGFKISGNTLHELLNSNFVESFNPIVEYINQLPDWDGETDYIQVISETVTVTDSELFAWAFKKWFVAYVMCAYSEKEVNQTALIFTGDQGLGKTTWILNLVPRVLKEYRYSGKVNPSNKDSTLLLSDKILINIDELASYTSSQVEAYKELITKTTVTERRAYGRFAENYIRRASFAGSSNHNEILMDATGNRRFLVFEAIKKFEYPDENLINMAFSQALSMFKAGFKYYFEGKDIERIEENNIRYKQSSFEEELISKYFKRPTRPDSELNGAMNASEIVQYLKETKNVKANLNIITIGKVMNSKGFTTSKYNGIKKYILERIEEE